MNKSRQLKDLPAGATIILATTSPDKRSEYENIFKRFDVNFIFLDDLGLSPQKTDEMTNTYDGNLIQKACELSLALHTNKEVIKDRLGRQGFDVSKPIVGMVEDSGIAISPKNPAYREDFNAVFKQLLEQRIHTEFEHNKALRNLTFPDLSNDKISNYLYCAMQNNNWMFEIGAGNTLPGPNFKPIFETLKGGMREIFDVMYDTLDLIVDSSLDKATVSNRRSLRFLNHCSIMLVPPLANPVKHITAEDIVFGENKGWLKSRKEVEELFAARCNPAEIELRPGEFFTGDMLIPDGQKDTSDLSQQELINAGMLWTKNSKRANYYRLEAVGKLKEKYSLSIAIRYKYVERVSNCCLPTVMVLYCASEKSALVEGFENKLIKEGFEVVAMPSPEHLLHDPESRLMEMVDIVFLMADSYSSELEISQLALGAAVDKQVMPSAKEKRIIALNKLDGNGRGSLDSVFTMLRQAKMGGLKNGLSEIDHIVEYQSDISRGADIYKLIRKVLKKEAARKKLRFTSIEPIQSRKNIANKNIRSIDKSKFNVFVAGGAANEYLEFKAPANQLGRFIHKNGWVLVTGAGQKTGPMGAVHSGFVESYLKNILNIKSSKNRRVIKSVIDHKITDIIISRRLTGNMATNFSDDILQAIFVVPDAEFLAHEAPDILDYLLHPKRGSESYNIIGSLKDSGSMVGYSMPALLISEGSGKWPVGMQGRNAGNMQRRMHEMLKSEAHVFLTGGQGTYQELIESVYLAVENYAERKSSGLRAKPIYVLNQETYKNGIYVKEGTVFRPVLEEIDRVLGELNMSRNDIGLEVFANLRKLESRLINYKRKHWRKPK